MKSEIVKKAVKNEKSRQIKGKITKSYSTFCENKPNLSEDKLGLKHFSKRIYKILTAWRGKKQTQFKPNTNPISERPKMNLNQYITMNYEIFFRLFGKKTKPNKPNSKQALSLCLRCMVEGSSSLSSVCAFLLWRSDIYQRNSLSLPSPRPIITCECYDHNEDIIQRK